MRHLILMPTLMLTLGLPLLAHEGWNRHEDRREGRREARHEYDHRREICRPCPPPMRPLDRCERPVRIDAWRWHERGRVHYEAVRPVIVTPAPIVVAPSAPVIHARPRIQVWLGF